MRALFKIITCLVALLVPVGTSLAEVGYGMRGYSSSAGCYVDAYGRTVCSAPAVSRTTTVYTAAPARRIFAAQPVRGLFGRLRARRAARFESASSSGASCGAATYGASCGTARYRAASCGAQRYEVEVGCGTPELQPLPMDDDTGFYTPSQPLPPLTFYTPADDEPEQLAFWSTADEPALLLAEI